MAGEVVAVGPDAGNWKAGDRVIASPTPSFTAGTFRDAAPVTDYGAAQEGVLTEYKIAPAHVSLFLVGIALDG